MTVSLTVSIIEKALRGTGVWLKIVCGSGLSKAERVIFCLHVDRNVSLYLSRLAGRPTSIYVGSLSTYTDNTHCHMR